jgi:hypothetical protein
MALLLGLLPASAFAIGPQLVAGQSEQVGWVTITDEGAYLSVNYRITASGWCISKAQVHVADSLDGIPQNRGGAIPGRFDYKASFEPCTRGYEFQIPIQQGWEGNDIYIAVHADVIGPDGQKEGAWAVRGGDPEAAQFSGRNWSAYVRFRAADWDD